MKQHIPNTVTCLNLFSGCLGIVFAFNGDLIFASYAIFFAALLDFLDGMLARLLKAYSELGKQLDSLADMVSFGVLPSVIIYHLFLATDNISSFTWMSFLAFIIAVFSGLRLAKFNIDTRQSENFIGLPTPANALLIASFPFLLQENNMIFMTYIMNPIALLVFSLIMSLLLISEIPLISLKFKSLSFSENKLRYLLIISSLVLIILFKIASLPIIMILYILISLVNFRNVSYNNS